jgi:hypothetical protein
MKKLLLALLLVGLWTSEASAYWQTHWVTRTVKVWPQPRYEICSLGTYHLVQPPAYWEERTVQESYWVPDPIIYSTAPVYVTPIYTLPPVYVSPPCTCLGW